MKRILSKIIYSFNYILPKKWQIPKVDPKLYEDMKNAEEMQLHMINPTEYALPPFEVSEALQEAFGDITVKLNGKISTDANGEFYINHNDVDDYSEWE